MKWIFESFAEWWLFTRSSFVHLAKGIVRLVLAVVLGMASVMVWLWKTATRWVGKYPDIALGAFLVIICITCVLWFAKFRATKNGLEAQRDSIAWQYQSFKEGHGYE
jgi:Na+/melibiose symporter-like transporter